MKLFHETENKYYELLSYLVNGAKEYSDKDIIHFLKQYITEGHDYEVEDVLFDHHIENASVLMYEDGRYRPVVRAPLPVRCSVIEQQAFLSLGKTSFSKQFLPSETIKKISNIADNVPIEWTLDDITIKNQYEGGISKTQKNYAEALKTIIRAIQQNKAIIYDNIVPGKFEFHDAEVFPTKVEYSFINDLFRICGYDQDADRFIKMNLISMSNIRLSEKTIANLEEEYKEYLAINTKKVILDVEPIDHVVERCFRIFSYYERLARFDKDHHKYTLEISYLKADEPEVIRDILSLGGYVVVTEPRRLQKEVYKRIVQARDRYK